jgi:ATP-dependent helicase/DNAse subunit B
LINSLERKRLNAHLSAHFKTDESEKRNTLQKIYSIISVNRKLSYLSTSKTNTSGIELYPSGYFRNLINCLTGSVEPAEKNVENLTQLLLEIADENYTQKENDDAYFTFLDFIENKKYSKRISNALHFMYRDKSKFDVADPGSVFKERDYFSATMLESYNKCPFKNYVDYGIKPQKLNIFEETPADIGDYYHAVISMFFDKIEKENIFFNTLE